MAQQYVGLTPEEEEELRKQGWSDFEAAPQPQPSQAGTNVRDYIPAFREQMYFERLRREGWEFTPADQQQSAADRTLPQEPVPTRPESRSWLGDIASGAARSYLRATGAVGDQLGTLAEIAYGLGSPGAAQTLEENAHMFLDVNQALRDKYPFLRPSKEEEEARFRRGVVGGIENVGQSMTSSIPWAIAGGIAGGLVGSLGAGVGAVPGAIAGARLGFTFGGGLSFGLAEYHNALHEALSQGIPIDEARKMAAKSGAIEWIGETAAGWGIGKAIGIFAPVGRAASDAATMPLKEAFKRPLRQKLFGLGKLYGTEVGTEMLQEAGEAYVRRDIGMTMGTDEMGRPIPYDPWYAAVEAIIPALTMTTLMTGGHNLAQRWSRRKVYADLQNPEADAANRMDAVSAVVADLVDTDESLQPVADMWAATAIGRIVRREAIPIDMSITEMADEDLKTMAGDIQIRATAEQRASIVQYADQRMKDLQDRARSLGPEESAELLWLKGAQGDPDILTKIYSAQLATPQPGQPTDMTGGANPPPAPAGSTTLPAPGPTQGVPQTPENRRTPPADTTLAEPAATRDPLWDRALDFLSKTRDATVETVQNALGVGIGRATRLINGYAQWLNQWTGRTEAEQTLPGFGAPLGPRVQQVEGGVQIAPIERAGLPGGFIPQNIVDLIRNRQRPEMPVDLTGKANRPVIEGGAMAPRGVPVAPIGQNVAQTLPGIQTPAVPIEVPTAAPQQAATGPVALDIRDKMLQTTGGTLTGGFTGERLMKDTGFSPKQLQEAGLIEQREDGMWTLTAAVTTPAAEGMPLTPEQKAEIDRLERQAEEGNIPGEGLGELTDEDVYGTLQESGSDAEKVLTEFEANPTPANAERMKAALVQFAEEAGAPLTPEQADLTNQWVDQKLTKLQKEKGYAEGTGGGVEEGRGPTGIQGGAGGPIRVRDHEEPRVEAGEGEAQGKGQVAGAQEVRPEEEGVGVPPPKIEGGAMAPKGPAVPTAAGQVRIKPGYGYWNTTEYPIGGKFERAGNEGVIVTNVEEIKPVKGVDRIGVTSTGQKIAFSSQNIETVEAAPAPAARGLKEMTPEETDELFKEVFEAPPAKAGAEVAPAAEAPVEGGPKVPKVYGPKKQPEAGTQADALKRAAELGIKGMDEAIKGIYELFGAPGKGGKLQTGIIGFDRESYEKAKPHFQASYDAFMEAGKTAKDFVVYWKDLAGEKVRALLRAFVNELQTGVAPVFEGEVEKIELTEEGEEVGTEEAEEAAEEGKPKRTRRPKVEGGAKVTPGMENVSNVGTVYDPYKRTLDRDKNKRSINKTLDETIRTKAFTLVPQEGATPGTIRYMDYVRKQMSTFQEYFAKSFCGLEDYKTWGFNDAVFNWVLDKQETEDTRNERMNTFLDQAARYLAIAGQLNKAASKAKDVTSAVRFIKEVLYDENNKKREIVTDNIYMFKSVYNMVDEHCVGHFRDNENEESVTFRRFVHPRNENLERVNLPDYRNGKDVSSQQLKDQFSFHGVGYGEESYMTMPDRIKFTNWAYDSMRDLAAIFNISDKVIGWWDGMQMQFGNLGTMMSKAAAFFIPNSNIINLTKGNGDGTIAHEWAHSWQYNLLAFGTEEVKTAVNALLNRFQERLDFDLAEEWIKEKFKPGSEEIRKFHTGYKYRGKRGLDLLREVINDEYEGIVRRQSNFYEASALVGNAMYQTRETEMWARAYEAYVYDKLIRNDASNNFLVNEYAAEDFVSHANGYRGLIYPSGIERTQFNDEIEQLRAGLIMPEDESTIAARPANAPSIAWKADYETATQRLEKRVAEEKAKLMARLEEIWKSLYPGQQSADKLYWYAYRITRRSVNMQPKGYWAYDDKFQNDEQKTGGGKGAVAYPEQLHPDHVDSYKLINVVHDVNDNKIYLPEDQRDVGTIGGGTLEGIPTEHGQPIGEGGGPETGAGEGGGGGTLGGEGAQEGGVGPVSGPAIRDGEVSAPPVGEGGAESPARPPTFHVGNFVFEDDGAHDVARTVDDRFTANVAALRILKDLEAAGRPPTKDEKIIMSYYSGWGGMGEAFYRYATGAWLDRRDMLQTILTEDEMRGAGHETDVAYFTPIKIYRQIWDVLSYLGFDGGKVLGPAIGIGNEFGSLTPNLVGKVQFTGVEPDNLSYRIARLLYNDHSTRLHNNKFEQVMLPKGHYQVVISNVPFTSTQPADRIYNEERFELHDYMIRRSLVHLKPGGILAVITSTGTMDKKETQLRRVVQKEGGRLIAALRLPPVFSQASASSDVLFIQKKGEGTPENISAWTELKTIKTKDKYGYDETIETNEAYTRINEKGEIEINSANFLGDAYKGWDQRSDARLMVKGTIEDAVARMRDFFSKYVKQGIMQIFSKPIAVPDLVPAPAEILPGRYYDDESGDLFYKDYHGEAFKFTGVRVRDDDGNLIALDKQIEMIRSFMKMRDQLRAIMRGQSNNDPKEQWEAAQKALRELYDAHVSKYGTVNETIDVYNEDEDSSLVLVVEIKKEDSDELIPNETVFSGTWLTPIEIPNHAENAMDAMLMSLNWKGHIDLDYMSGLMGTPEDEILAELGTSIYNDPEAGWVTADLYLSGNVRRKLELAKEIAKQDAAYQRNVKALEAVQPQDKVIAQIIPKIGTSWVPREIMQDFVDDIAGLYTNYHLRATIQWSKEMGRYTMFYNPVHYMRHPKPYVRRQIEKASKDPRAVSGIGTSLRGLSFYDLFPRILNGEIALVMKPNPERGGQPIKDEEETQKARAVQIAIQDKFKEWIKEHPDKATAVEQAYNREVNNTVEWKPNGRHLKLYGKAASVGLWPDPKTGEILPLRGHQLDAIWRWMMKGNTYYAHDMGTGKTFSLVATAMEARRLGLRKRPMLVVKLATLNQIERDFKRLYPTARVLVLHVTSNQDENRRQMAKIVSQDWDCIIVPDSQYNKITLSPERQHLMLKEDLKQFEEYLEASRAAEESEEFGARAKKKQKDLAKQIRALEDRIRLKQLAVQARAYGFLDFDEMGVDMILVDEAHTYKNIPFETKYDERGYHLQGISGGGPEEGQNAQNYYWKMRYMNDAHPGGIVLSSGTPITNSISELFNIQRVLEPEVLTETGSLMFDGWVANYGRIEDDTEVSETGQSYRNVTRFTKFVNTGQLMRQVYNVMDFVTSEQAGIVRPELAGGETQVVDVPQNYLVRDYNTHINDRVARILGPGGGHATWGVRQEGNEIQDIKLRLIGEGQLAAIDPRFIEHGAPDLDQTKLNYMAKMVLWHYKNPPIKDTLTPEAVDKNIENPNAPDKGDAWIDPYSGKYNGVQIVFIDKGSPDSSIKTHTLTPPMVETLPETWADLYLARDPNVDFNYYGAVIDKLVSLGIPREEIITIYDVDKKGRDLKKQAKAKEQFESDMNSGKYRVLLASTKKAGLGYNIQKRVVAMHHMDVWWNYATFAQATARGWRFGNINPYVHNYVYVVPGTVDGFVWGVVTKKQETFDSLFSGLLRDVEEIEDVSKETMSLMEIAATASGNPLLKEKATLYKRNVELKREHEEWAVSHRRAQIFMASADEDIRAKEAEIQRHKEDIALMEQITGVVFYSEGKVYRLKDMGGDIAKALEELEKQYRPKITGVPLDSPSAKVSIGNVGIIEKVEGEKKFTMKERLGTVYMAYSLFNTKLISLGIALQKTDVSRPFSHIGDNKKVEITGNLSRTITGGIENKKQKMAEKQSEIELINQQKPVNEKILKTTFDKGDEIEANAERIEEIDQIMQNRTAGGMSNPTEGALFTYYQPRHVYVDDIGKFSGWTTDRGYFRSDNIALVDSPKDFRRVRKGNFPRPGDEPSNYNRSMVEALGEHTYAPRRPKFPFAYWDTGTTLGTLIFLDTNNAIKEQDWSLLQQVYRGKDLKYWVGSHDGDPMVMAWDPEQKHYVAAIRTVTADLALRTYNSSLRPRQSPLTELPANILRIAEMLDEGKSLQEIAASMAPIKELPPATDISPFGEIEQPEGGSMLDEDDVEEEGINDIDTLVQGLLNVKDTEAAMPRLVAIGRHVIREGVRDFRRFITRMREIIGAPYDRFKSLMVRVYNQAKASIRKVVDSDEGTIRMDMLIPRAIGEKMAKASRKPTAPPERAPFQFMGARLYNPEQAHPLTSAANNTPAFDLGLERTGEVDENTPAGELIKHVRGDKFLSKFLLDIPNSDLRRWEELMSLPWYIAKRHPEFRPFIDIELNREEERQEMTLDLSRSPNKSRADELHEILKLSGKEAKLVGEAIVYSDAEQVLLSNDRLREQFHLNSDKLQSAYFAWWRSMQVAWKVKLAYAEASLYWTYMDRAWMNPQEEWAPYREFKVDEKGKPVKDKDGKPVILKHTEGPLSRLRMSDLQLVVEGFMTMDEALRRIPDQGSEEAQEKAEKQFKEAAEALEAPAKTIRYYRKQWGKVKFYFPRVREQGDYVVRVWQGEGEEREAVYSERVYNEFEAKRVVKKLIKEGYSEDQIEGVYSPLIPETMYGDLEEAAMSKFIGRVIGKMEHDEYITPEQAKLLQEGLFQSIAEELNKRGFGMHAVPRRENLITGYKTDDVQKIFKNYMSGLAGFLTKRKAAYEFHRALNGMSGPQREGKKAKPHMFEYARTYARDMLYNTERMDKICAWLRALAFAYYLAGNFKSAAVNFTQNYVVAIPELAKYTKSYGRAFARYHKAMKDIRSDASMQKNLTGDELAALHEVINKGVTTDQYIQEITARGEGAGELFDKLNRWVSYPFRWVEVKNRQAAFIAAYRTFMTQGMGHTESVRRAKNFVYDTHFLYGKANLPQWARGPTAVPKLTRLAYTFRSYTHSFILGMIDNLRGLPGGRRNVATVAQTLAALVILGGIPAFPWLDDIMDILEKWLGYPVRARMYAWLQGVGGDILRTFGESGLPGVVAGVDLSGSLKIGLPRPTLRGTEEAIYGVYGGLIDKGMKALEALQSHDPVRAIEEASPSFITNVFKAKREYERGVTTATGRVKYGEDQRPMKLTAGESVSRAAGFRQAREAHAAMEMRSFDNMRTKYANDRNHLKDRWLAADTGAEKRAVLLAVQAYNRSVLKFRGAVPRLTIESLNRGKQIIPGKPFRQYQNWIAAEE